jgi:site-specific recombinase XerD
MFLYKTSAELLGEVPGLGRDAASALARAGVEPGMPFVLAPDGAYDVALNRFFRDLPDWGVRSANSQAAYARDLTLFCRFLYQRRGGRTIWQADQEDLRAFKVVRRRVGVEQGRITAGTWNRFIAALDKWVEWAVHEDLLLDRPFRRVERTVMTDRGLVRLLVNGRDPVG